MDSRSPIRSRTGFAVVTRFLTFYESIKEENTRELFDLAADPQERVNLSSTFSKKTAELASQLTEWKNGHIIKESVQNRVSEEDFERLKALGYVD